MKSVKQPNTVSRTHDTSIVSAYDSDQILSSDSIQPPGFTTTAVSCNTCPGGQSVATIPASLVSGSSSNTVPSNPSPSPNGLSSSLGNSASTTSPGTPQFTGAGSNTAKEGFLIMGVLAAFVPILFTCID